MKTVLASELLPGDLVEMTPVLEYHDIEDTADNIVAESEFGLVSEVDINDNGSVVVEFENFTAFAFRSDHQLSIEEIGRYPSDGVTIHNGQVQTYDDGRAIAKGDHVQCIKRGGMLSGPDGYTSCGIADYLPEDGRNWGGENPYGTLYATQTRRDGSKSYSHIDHGGELTKLETPCPTEQHHR